MIALLILLVATQSTAAPDPNDPARQPVASQPTRFQLLQKRAFDLIEATRKFRNWDEEAAAGREAISKIFERAGWDSSEDVFALEMIRAVDSIPPWQFEERGKRFFGLLGKRYGLDDEQRQRLEQVVVREATGLFAEHSERILGYATEIIQTRAAGEPFTPEQVARWSELGAPVLNDAHARMMAAAQEFAEELDPAQREIVLKDLAAADVRAAMSAEMLEDWKRGHWEAADWGLDEDATQLGKRSQASKPDSDAPTAPANPEFGSPQLPQAPAAPQPDRVVRPTTPKAELVDQHPWAQYVRAFVAKYQLDESQAQKAWVIYDQARTREAEVAQRSPGVAEQAGRSKNTDDRATAELNRVFGRMKMRLDSLPTRAQRRNATPAELPAPASRPHPQTAPHP